MSSQVRVLLIDDETVFLDSMSKVLRARGYLVGVARDGAAGLEELGIHDYDVVVLDQRMPGMDGVTTLDHIRSTHPILPVIMLSGQAQMATAVDAMTHGAVDYLLKPALVEKLCERIQTAMEKKTLLEHLPR
ncbi:MAG: response regulator [Acidobacteria bacterium]|nr:response regulator [Acidobacteriota bacterium]